MFSPAVSGSVESVVIATMGEGIYIGCHKDSSEMPSQLVDGGILTKIEFVNFEECIAMEKCHPPMSM